LTLDDYRVPLLGDIPIIGYLFKSIGRKREKTNLYVFLTPRIIDTEEKSRSLYQEKARDADRHLEIMKDPSKATGNENAKP